MQASSIINFLLIFCIWLSNAQQQNHHCGISCAKQGVEITTNTEVKNFLLCCDGTDCQTYANKSQLFFKMPEHMANKSFSCELICDNKEESPSTAKYLSEDDKYSVTVSASSSHFYIYLAVGSCVPILVLFTLWVYCRKVMKLRNRSNISQVDNWMVNWTPLPTPIHRTSSFPESNDTIENTGDAVQSTSRHKFVEIDIHAHAAIPDRPPQINFSKDTGYISAFKRQFLITTALFCCVHSAYALPCVNFERNQFDFVDSDDCVSQGYIVYMDKNSNNFCERKINCPDGYHIRFDPKSRDDCKEACKCPDWAKDVFRRKQYHEFN